MHLLEPQNFCKVLVKREIGSYNEEVKDKNTMINLLYEVTDSHLNFWHVADEWELLKRTRAISLPSFS